jgi:hypothetical protein
MRCRPFDAQTSEALHKLGFTISDDGEVAKIADEMAVEIVWPNHPKVFGDDEFVLTIELPNGMELDGKTWRDKLLHAAGIEPDEMTRSTTRE